MLRLCNPVLFEQLLWPTFVEQDGSYYVVIGPEERFAAASSREARDLEWHEWSQNHFHLFDIFEHDIPMVDGEHGEELQKEHEDFHHGWEIAKRLAQAWAAGLRARFPDKEFIVVATRMSGPILRFFHRRNDALLGPPEEYFTSLLMDDSGYYIPVNERRSVG